ncbi:MAG: hypothetical protein ACJ8AO_12285 [Gemmatimonadaceae bacterium]|jgi:hypothetical protein
MADWTPRSWLLNARPLGGARVRIIEHAGRQWRVYESRLGQYDRRSRPHLFFESAEAVRRVRDFPPDWYELPDADLISLSEHR